jgi:acetate kinase
VTAERTILSLNSGSSSRKAAIYRIGIVSEQLLVQASAERLETGQAVLRITRRGETRERALSGPDASAAGALPAIFRALAALDFPQPDAAGHRIVHGGPNHVAPEKVSARLVGELRELIAFAPLHLPEEIRGIEETAARFPGLPQVVCFDTAFHRTMPEYAERFALPRELYSQGIRRYGFHGISYEYILHVLGAAVPPRLIIAHLGSGASMVAIRDGRSIDTTMGFGPTGGFMMSTRSGDLDPSVIVHLMRAANLDAAALERLVNDQSGLLGVSGTSSDMKTLLQRRAGDPDAAMAIEMFCYQARKHLVALTAALGGADLIVFTGGIGERAAEIRDQICRGLEYLGVALDDGRNRANEDTVSANGSRCTVRVIPTDEDLMIARHTWRTSFADAPGAS